MATRSSYRLEPRKCAQPPERREWQRVLRLIADARDESERRSAASPPPPPPLSVQAQLAEEAAVRRNAIDEKRIAFCFLLSYGDVAQPNLWLSFFGRSASNESAPGRLDSLFNVYAHQDARLQDDARLRDPENRHASPPDASSDSRSATALRRPFWRQALIPARWRVRTDYRNGTSLDLARMALFAYAYRNDGRNYKFVLLSESCIPLHPLSRMHALLTRDGRSAPPDSNPPLLLLLRSSAALQPADRHALISRLSQASRARATRPLAHEQRARLQPRGRPVGGQALGALPQPAGARAELSLAAAAAPVRHRLAPRGEHRNDSLRTQ